MRLALTPPGRSFRETGQKPGRKWSQLAEKKRFTRDMVGASVAALAAPCCGGFSIGGAKVLEEVKAVAREIEYRRGCMDCGGFYLIPASRSLLNNALFLDEARVHTFSLGVPSAMFSSMVSSASHQNSPSIFSGGIGKDLCNNLARISKA